MRPVIFRCPPSLFALLVLGACAPVGVLPLVPESARSPTIVGILVGIMVFMVGYALTLLPTKLVVSNDGLCQKQLLSELRLSWSDIAEWRYFRVFEGEGFWIRDKQGRQHDLKKWLISGKRRSQQLAEILRKKGIAGREEYCV